MEEPKKLTFAEEMALLKKTKAPCPRLLLHDQPPPLLPKRKALVQMFRLYYPYQC